MKNNCLEMFGIFLEFVVCEGLEGPLRATEPFYWSSC